MKINKSIFFSLFFLASIVVSFGINTFQSFSFKKVENNISTNKRVFSKLHADEINVNDFLFEENENEEDEDINAFLSVVPVILNAIFSKHALSYHFCFDSNIKQQSTPIYLSACNFRI
jgi:hypothetical protein